MEHVTEDERILVQKYIDEGSEACLDGEPIDSCSYEGYFVIQAWRTGWEEADGVS